MPIFDFKVMPFSLERCEDWLQTLSHLGPCKAPVERPSVGVRCSMFELVILVRCSMFERPSVGVRP